MIDRRWTLGLTDNKGKWGHVNRTDRRWTVGLTDNTEKGGHVNRTDSGGNWD